MARYLRIQNEGVCGVELFTRLGLSGSRGQEGKIGQFGTGQTMGMLTMLRHGYTPTVFCGLTRIVYEVGNPVESRDAFGNAVLFQPVSYKVSNRRPVDMGVALSHGETEWDNVDMALREFVSNAIDNSIEGLDGVKIDIVNNPTPRQGKTIVYIKLTPAVKAYYYQLGDKFLHFNNRGLNTPVMRKIIPGTPPQIFRKGVWVSEIGETPSVFDYNMGDNLPIDESRKLGNSDCERICAKHLCSNLQLLEQLIKSLICGDVTWESVWSVWTFRIEASSNRTVVQEAWQNATNGALLATPSQGPLVDHARALGRKVCIVNSSSWADVLAYCGVQTILQGLQDIDENGFKILDPTPQVRYEFRRCWDALTILGETDGKEEPKLATFIPLINEANACMGIYDPKTQRVAIRDTNYEICTPEENAITMLHEIGHHLSGGGDADRNFESWLCRIATKALILNGM